MFAMLGTLVIDATLVLVEMLASRELPSMSALWVAGCAHTVIGALPVALAVFTLVRHQCVTSASPVRHRAELQPARFNSNPYAYIYLPLTLTRAL